MPHNLESIKLRKEVTAIINAHIILNAHLIHLYIMLEMYIMELQQKELAQYLLLLKLNLKQLAMVNDYNITDDTINNQILKIL